MAISIWVVFDDGRETLVLDHDDFAEAVERVIDIAESFGSASGDDRGSPRMVHVRRNGSVALSLTVLRGSLLRPTEAGR